MAQRADETDADPSSERTPLLASEPSSVPGTAGSSARRSSQDEGEQPDETEEVPLPKTQIFLLCYTSVVEPIAFFGIFPYINFMIENVGNVEKEDVGFYSGLIESLFSATQMCVMIFWGKASDRYGRKPVLVFSLVGVSFATVLFGLSQSLSHMIASRCLAGVFAGTVVTTRAMLSENSTKATQARAFSYFAFARNLGLFMGPILGGALERPATKFPSAFGRFQFFHDYPYALPSIVTAIISITSALTTALFVKETLHISKNVKKADGPPLTTWQLLRHPGVAQVVLIFNYVMLQAYTYTAVSPVYSYLPVELGGLGFPPEGIAGIAALGGAAQSIWLLVVFSRLHNRVGTYRLLMYCAIAWPIFFAAAPMFNELLRHHLTPVFWATAPITLVMGSGVAMAFTGVQLAVNDIAPSHETLGTLNSIVLALQSGLRAVAPALATSIYAVGVKYHILDGHLFWLLNVLLAVGLIFVLRLLPQKVRGNGKEVDEDDV